MASSASVPSLIAQSSSDFSSDLFSKIVKSTENVVFSPASVQTCVTLALFGAKGKTESEMINGLHLGTSDKDVIAKRFTNLMKSSNANLSLNIANKIYVTDELHIKEEFNAVAKKAFFSEAESINFKEGDKAVKTINSWVESKTNNKIKNLLTEVESETSMILVNAIHLKAKWKHAFNKDETHKRDFWLTKDLSVEVDTMTKSDAHYYYAEWSDLDAVAIGMPYKDSDLSMVIVLPNQRDGLNELEKKIPNVNLLELANKMTTKTVYVFLPKFKIESEFNLNDALKKMGMSTMFSGAAEFYDLFEEQTTATISDIVHKAFINVDEKGTEASAATLMKIKKGINYGEKLFDADHPFIYFIKNQDYIYFMGHVTKF